MTMAKLQRIDVTTLHERAYQELRKALMTGAYKPGEAVTLRGVAEALGTSLMPAREAVRRLVSERALEMPNSRSVRVPLMQLRTFDELYRIRQMLEPEAAARAAERCDKAGLVSIREANDGIHKALKAGNFAEVLAMNQQFHAAVYAACDSEILLMMIDTLWLQSGPYLNLFIDSMDRSALNSEFAMHDDVIEAMAANNAIAARESIRLLIANAARLFRARVGERTGETAPKELVAEMH
ncbi:GntR family transcriptional regulator [Sphingomonas sp. 28-63-12]|uniref:GntR family transcriptional regulator n=1 Tax=Sphingomonas sp. 28-63-12 TaxID=1970434 RepID=UPI0035A81FF2